MTALVGAWTTRAACAGQARVMTGDEQAAKALCESCPVIADCTRWVLPLGRDDPGGVVAGLTEADRKMLRDRRRGYLAAEAKRRNEAARARREAAARNVGATL